MNLTQLLECYRNMPILLEGGNFSGRTVLLQSCVSHYCQQNDRAIYVGSSIHRHISSLMANVRDELYLHFTRARHKKWLLTLAEEFGLTGHFRQSPFTLSGGEQALLVALCKLGLEPSLLAFDCALGELDANNSIRIAQVFSTPMAGNITTLITENSYRADHSWCLPIQRAVSEFIDSPEAMQTPRFYASDLRINPPKNTGCLEAERLYFAYDKGTPILRGASFCLKPGRIYSIEGRNGAGKSTLGRLLVGALRSQGGQIYFSGQKIKPWKQPGQIVAMHVQNPDVQLVADSVAEEVSDLPCGLRQSVVTLAGVEVLMKKHPFDLPFVLRKRLTFSIIVHLRRPWLVFDEPTLGQDANACDQMVAILRNLAKDGAGIITISHSREFIRRLQAQRLWLEDGFINELGDDPL